MGILEVPGVSAADAQARVDARTVVDVVAVSLAGTLALNKLTQVHADAAPRTMLLPTGAPKGTVVTVEKSDATTNAVTVSGVIRGVSASLALTLANESIQFVADSAGSWNPSAGHKTLTSLKTVFVSKTDVAFNLDAATYSGNDAALDALFTALPAGAAVEIQQGVMISRTTPITLPKKVRIQGLGTLLDARPAPTTGFVTVTPAASGSEITCRLVGSVTGTYVNSHHGIVIQGVDNGAGVAPTYVTGVRIDSPEISGFGSMAVFGEFVQGAVIDIRECHNLGYAGVIIQSALDVNMRIRYLHDLTPGTAGNSYGMNYTRRGATSDLIRYPISRNSFAYIDVMRNVPDWDGMGCHGGDGLYFGFGTMYGVKRPFDIVAATTAGGEAAFAPNNITAVGGYADSGVTDGTSGPAVNIAGAFKATDVLGTPTEYAKGIHVTVGTLRGYGNESSTNSGTVYCHSTQGLVLDAGSISEASPYAVCVYHDNKDFLITGVSASDPWTNGGTVAGIVRVASTFNTGTIVAAKGSRGAKTATIVNSQGLRVFADASNVIRIGDGCDFSSATVPISGTAQCVWGIFGANVGQQPNTTDLRLVLQNLGLLGSGGISPLNLSTGAFTAGAITARAHIVSVQATPPTVLASAASGTGAPLPTFDVLPTDNRFGLNLGTGTTATAGDQARVAYSSSFGVVPLVVVCALNAATAALNPYVSSTGTGFCIIAYANPPALSQAVGTYHVSVIVAG